MNKYLFILGLVGTALFSACSTSDDLTLEEPNRASTVDRAKEAALILEAGQDSEIPITVGVGDRRGMTRSVLNPKDEAGNFETENGKYLGVFCLAMGTHSGVSNIPATISANNWNTAPADDQAGLIVRMKNIPAKVTTDLTTSDVKFWDITNDRALHYYYPMGNWMWYNFYAYYPRQGDETLSFTPNQALQTNYVIDGSQDIIWGMANPEDAMYDDYAATDAKPYCAKYFRLKGAVEEENIGSFLPKFVFKHKLIQFRFFVKAANATVLTDLTGKHMQVTDMYINNAYYKLRLIVANKANPEYNGDLSKYDNSTKELKIKKYNSDLDRFNQDGNPLDITNDNVDVTTVDGDGNPTDPGFVGYIMLPDPTISKVDGFKYTLMVKVKFTTDYGTPEAAEHENTLSLELDPPTGGFLEGKIYNILVNVQSPVEIHARALLNRWVIAPETIEYGN